LIYVSLGTVHHAQLDFYRTAFAAFADHPGQFVLSIGPHASISDLGAIPANFIVRTSVPQLEILQRADVFVTHGGMNSVQEGLYYGVPLVLIPQQIEQLFNARVVESHAAGIILGDAPTFGRVTAAQLRQAVERALKNPLYREKAQVLGAALRETGGYVAAADEIEKFIQRVGNSDKALTVAH
jgi:MGT family glycosyltransferase